MQLAIGLVLAGAWGLGDGGRSASAALTGAGISALLSAYMGLKVFARDAKADSSGAFRALVRAEFVKLLLAAVLVSFAIIAFREHTLPLITTLGATLLAYWLALLRAPN